MLKFESRTHPTAWAYKHRTKYTHIPHIHIRQNTTHHFYHQPFICSVDSVHIVFISLAVASFRFTIHCRFYNIEYMYMAKAVALFLIFQGIKSLKGRCSKTESLFEIVNMHTDRIRVEMSIYLVLNPLVLHFEWKR